MPKPLSTSLREAAIGHPRPQTIATEQYVRAGADEDMGASLGSTDAVAVRDGIAAPDPKAGFALIYVDSADDTLKIKFSDGTVVDIAAKVPL